MNNPKNEKEYIVENSISKNNENSNTLKRKLNELYADENFQSDQLKGTCAVVNNGNAWKRCDTTKDRNTLEYFPDDVNILEKKDVLLNKNDEINTEEAEEKTKSHINEPNRKKRKKKERKKKLNDQGEMTKPAKQMVRINYLLQSSFLMNEFNPDISREYIKTMRKLSNKFLIKHDKKFKKLFCKKCNSVLIPSATCKVSVNPLNLRKKGNKKSELVKDPTPCANNNFNVKSRDEYLVSYRCNHCQHDTKFVYDNNLVSTHEKED
ncbi:ribonuclease P protein subunit RPR2 [Plasmodium gonderi]|uniref:Ribonuclease P protein subunit RPR2 n=1 Tax=Plasmodium gonderi TaxID=77519 RepID=A0A1Y1JJ85_PLAGO|nr:ribonuclease P protein subunit RPR2 [Plasmodium gonderi]GAW82290.1 ribonuclease P protein subunit RPR2 [Plasmodium gonderi]